MSTQNNFTSLVGVKWTKNSMLKVHDMMWNNYIDEMLNKHQANYNEEVIRRINESYNWIRHIRKLCNNNDIAFKKKEEKK